CGGAAGPASGADLTADLPPGPAPLPWAFVLLGLSAVAAVVSGVSFGLPSVATLAASLAFAAKAKGDPDRKPAVALGAAALSAVGLAAGVVLSYLLFVRGRR
ncbi:MAG: hypothetical protein JWO31_1551, partial [Phycisphaerales bacterium]|nr:hypothetical protein [Phycisphaerales bacterium]